MGVQEYTRGLQGHTRVYKGLQGFLKDTDDYRGKEGYTRDYRGL